MTEASQRRRIATVISPDVLDQIGKDFRFNHGKGAVEWLKNSLDAYLVRRTGGLEEESGGWPVHLHLIDGRRGQTGPNLAVLDFAGASYDDVQNFLLTWFDTSAATRGNRTGARGLTGGHGNGGKFYMREMWRRNARFCTYLDGRASSLVVDRASDGTCGYWEHEDIAMPWRDAMEHAFEGSGMSGRDAEDFMTRSDPRLVDDLDNGGRGFTVVLGFRAVQIKNANDVVNNNRWRTRELIESIRSVPASHRPLQELAIRVAHGGQRGIERLQPEHIEEDPDWQPERHPVAAALPDPLDSSATIQLTGSMSGEVGELIIHKAKAALTGKMSSRNSVTVFDADGNPVGAFSIPELHAGSTDHTRFLFCELNLAFPELEEHVENDRESFRNSPPVEALKAWLRERIGACAAQAEAELRERQRRAELDAASALNRTLNDYARTFLRELETEVFVDWLDEEGGGEGGDGAGAGGGGRGNGAGGGSGEGGGRRDAPGNTQRVRRPRFPRILLSGHDEDPAEPGATRALSPSHPPIHQNDDDARRYNVWWINTSHPYASEAMSRGGVGGRAWKEYHFFMFRDIVQIEHLRMLQRRDSEMALDQLENELLQRSSDFLSRITQDIAEQILD